MVTINLRMRCWALRRQLPKQTTPVPYQPPNKQDDLTLTDIRALISYLKEVLRTPVAIAS